MKPNTKLKIIFPAIATVVALGIFGLYAYNTGGTTDAAHNTESTTIVHPALIEVDIDQLSKGSDVILIGTVTNVGPIKIIKLVQGEVEIPLTPVTVKIERELTGNYQGNEIQVTVEGDGTKYIVFDEPQFTVGEKVLLFLTHTDPSTVYGDVYVLRGGIQAKFAIDKNGITHNPKYGDIPVENLVSQILESRRTK